MSFRKIDVTGNDQAAHVCLEIGAGMNAIIFFSHFSLFMKISVLKEYFNRQKNLTIS